MTVTTSVMEPDTLPISCVMLVVALLVWVARSEISDATTAKPFPASPARAASMLAFNASRLVWDVTPLISSTIVFISLIY